LDGAEASAVLLQSWPLGSYWTPAKSIARINSDKNPNSIQMISFLASEQIRLESGGIPRLSEATVLRPSSETSLGPFRQFGSLKCAKFVSDRSLWLIQSGAASLINLEAPDNSEIHILRIESNRLVDLVVFRRLIVTLESNGALRFWKILYRP
jgi:hypothetical protein